MAANCHDKGIFHLNDSLMENYSARIMIGVPKFVACRTRPDIAKPLEILSLFSTIPNTVVINVATRVIG